MAEDSGLGSQRGCKGVGARSASTISGPTLTGKCLDQAGRARLPPPRRRAAQQWPDQRDDPGYLRRALLRGPGKPIQSQMVILGSMSLGGNIVPVENLAESLQVAFDSGGKRILLPMASVTDIPTIPGELFAKFQTSFYADPEMLCSRRWSFVALLSLVRSARRTRTSPATWRLAPLSTPCTTAAATCCRSRGC